MYRELHEEVGLKPEHVRILGRTRDWLRYNVPDHFVRREWRGHYKGQKQIWFLLRLIGRDSDVCLRATQHPEFDAWRWSQYWVPLDAVIEFKRDVYTQALNELSAILFRRHHETRYLRQRVHGQRAAENCPKERTVMRILLVEDERDMASWLMRALAQSGFVPDHAADARSAEAFMAGNEYDAIVMDLRLPDKHGLVVLREMRNRDDRTPVLLLTAQGALQDRVRGLNLGADDFLTKPFALEELEARLTALVRRRSPASPTAMRFAVLRQRKPRLHAGRLPAVPDPARARRPGGVADPQRLSGGQVAAVRQGFTHDSEANPDAIEVVLHRLRKKLAGSDVRIVTVRGLGYMLESVAAAPAEGN